MVSRAKILSVRATERHFQVARDVIENGMPFRKAAVKAGFTQKTADQGQKQMRLRTRGLDEAFTKVAMEKQWRPEELKALAVYRITKTAVDDKNTDNLKAAELIGKMKSVDLFVRNGEAQVGVFFGLLEANTDDLLPPTIDVKASEDKANV